MPTLPISGDGDTSTPPSVMRIVAKHVSNNERVVVPEAGHSVYREQPEASNRIVLDFIGRHISSLTEVEIPTRGPILTSR